MAKGRGKGPAYEREFCKQLSLWWSHGKKDDVFWRTPGSGARATVRMKVGMLTADSYGDVGAVRAMGKPLTKTTLIELKRGYTGKKGSGSQRHISFLTMIDTPKIGKRKKKPVLIEWWKKAQKERKKAGRKRVFIVFRRDRKESCLVISRKFFLKLRETNGHMMCPPYYGVGWINFMGTELMVIKVEDFFDWCKPELLGAPPLKIKRRKHARKIKRRTDKTFSLPRRRTTNSKRGSGRIKRRNKKR